MLFLIGLLPLAAWDFFSLHGHLQRGQLRTVWGKPDFGLCCYGWYPSWCGETSGFTHSLRLQGQSTDLQITCMSCDCSPASDTRRPQTQVLLKNLSSVWDFALDIKSWRYVSKSRALDDIVSHWKSTLHHWSHAAWTRIRIGPVWKFIPLNCQFLSLVNNLGICWLI